MDEQVAWTKKVNPDWPEMKWTATVGGLKLHVFAAIYGSDYSVVDAEGNTIAEGRCWGVNPLEQAKAAAEAVARIEVGDE